MDELDKILLQHLPDTGLCERSKAKQAQRRRNLHVAILGYIMNQARDPNAIVTKEGGTIRGFMEVHRDHNHSPELIIDEMQFDQQEKESKIPTNKALQRAENRSREMLRERYGSDFCEDKTTVRSDGVVMAQFKDECDPFKPNFQSGGTVENPMALIGRVPDTSKEHVLTEEQMRKINNYLK